MKSKITVNRKNIVGKVSENIFGALIEHVGRSVYNGIYEPEHANADENGFRQDVIECAKEMGITCIRYPGGNYVSGYDWKDGIGPKEKRPVKLNLAWKELEPNHFGLDEIQKWAEKTDTKVLMAVNMGNGTVKDAVELLEYCNFPKGSYWSDKRAENGSEKPYNIKFWCVGNEMDGDYQLGALSAEEYSRKACEAVKQMKIVDENAKFIICGSSSPFSPSFPDWDKSVIKNTYKYMDFLSVHAYYDHTRNGEINDFLASPAGFERHIETVVSLCDDIKEEVHFEKTIMLAVDEWNVWHTEVGEKHEHPWCVGEALIENNYNFADALVVAGMLSVLVNHCDRVEIACIAQLVNVIAPIMTETGGGILKQTTFYPFKMFSRCKGTVALKQEKECDLYESDTYGKAPYLYSSICYDDTNGEYAGYFINTGSEDIDLTLDFNEPVEMCGHTLLSADPKDKNTFEDKEKVVPKELLPKKTAGRIQNIKLDGFSINHLRFSGVNR